MKIIRLMIVLICAFLLCVPVSAAELSEETVVLMP